VKNIPEVVLLNLALKGQGPYFVFANKVN
jgi:hypothetical protein